MSVVYIRRMETYDSGIGGFKASFLFLWLFRPGVSALPAMPSVFGGTGWLCHLRRWAELCARARGERTGRGARVIYTGVIQPKSSGDGRNHRSRDLPKPDFMPCNVSFGCFVFKIYGLSVDSGL